MADKKKFVVMGGGTGTSMVLRGLRNFPVHLSAVISMADDGGSSGRLRRELGVLPPGDIRQCLLGLSDTDPAWQAFFDYRFDNGELKGHNAGNLLIAGLEKATGSFEQAVKTVAEMLNVQGEVIPVTLTPMTLGVRHGADQIKVLGEHVIDDDLPLMQPRNFFLEPRATINDRARRAIVEADLIVIGPGSISTSIIPTLIVNGVSEAINQSKAKLIYNVNLTSTPGQTDNYTIVDYLREVQSYLPRPIDVVFYHNGDHAIPLGTPTEEEKTKLRGANLKMADQPGCHNTKALAQLIYDADL